MRYIKGLHWYIPGIYLVYTLTLVYTWYIPGIYLVYTNVKNLLPGGWCCGGGQGPIPPVPPATTSPGLVITLILSLPALRQRGFLLLVMWVCRARFELKIACIFRSWQARHTKRSSATGAAAFMLSMTIALRKQECWDQSIPLHTCVRNLHLSTVS